MKSLYAMVGMRFRDAEEFVASLPDREPLLLLRQPNNPHDANAVAVWARGRHVGFIPTKENAALASRMDDIGRERADFKLEAKLVAGQWPQIEVEEGESDGIG